MPIAADPQDLQIDSAGRTDGVLEVAARGVEIVPDPGGHSNTQGVEAQGLGDVGADHRGVAPPILGWQTDVLIEGESTYLAHVQTALHVPDQFGIQAQRARPRRQPQHRGRPSTDELDHLRCRGHRHPGGVVRDDDFHVCPHSLYNDVDTMRDGSDTAGAGRQDWGMIGRQPTLEEM